MRKARLIVGRTAVGILVLAGGAASAAASGTSHGSRAVRGDEVSPRAAANGLAGEWDGQLEVRGADGTISTSHLGLSARLAADGERLELYYEGFAFGKPVEGAMMLSFAESEEGLSIRDKASGVQASCAPSEDQPDSPGAEDALAMSGASADHSRDIRALFSRKDADNWTIEYQARPEGGAWSPLLTMSLSRLQGDRRSAAADNFAASTDLRALRNHHATAAADE